MVDKANDEEKKCIYFVGNSLGLQPKQTSQLIKKVSLKKIVLQFFT